MGQLIDMTGWIMKEHGIPNSKLTVIKRNLQYCQIHNLKKKSVYWDCLCECGNVCTVRANCIRRGTTLSCGCVRDNPWNKKDLTGKKFGKLLVINDSGERAPKNGEIIWNCKCECGALTKVKTSSLNAGLTLSCGCLNSKGEYLIAQLLTKNKI